MSYEFKEYNFENSQVEIEWGRNVAKSLTTDDEAVKDNKEIKKLFNYDSYHQNHNC